MLFGRPEECPNDGRIDVGQRPWVETVMIGIPHTEPGFDSSVDLRAEHGEKIAGGCAHSEVCARNQ